MGTCRKCTIILRKKHADACAYIVQYSAYDRCGLKWMVERFGKYESGENS